MLHRVLNRTPLPTSFYTTVLLGRFYTPPPHPFPSSPFFPPTTLSQHNFDSQTSWSSILRTQYLLGHIQVSHDYGSCTDVPCAFSSTVDSCQDTGSTNAVTVKSPGKEIGSSVTNPPYREGNGCWRVYGEVTAAAAAAAAA